MYALLSGGLIKYSFDNLLQVKRQEKSQKRYDNVLVAHQQKLESLKIICIFGKCFTCTFLLHMSFDYINSSRQEG